MKVTTCKVDTNNIVRVTSKENNTVEIYLVINAIWTEQILSYYALMFMDLMNKFNRLRSVNFVYKQIRY